MGLRTKIFIIISLTLVGLIVALYIMSRTILLESFVQLETQYTRENVDRVLSALFDELDNLAISAQDYAEWDDTYTFVVDGNKDYKDSNLMDVTFVDLRLNLMVFVNTSGQTVFSKNFDLLNNREIDIPTGLIETLSANGPLANLSASNPDLRGLVLLPEGPMLVVARAILTNDSQGPSHGVLIFGRYLNSAAIEDLAQKTHLSLTTQLFDTLPLPSDFQAVKSALSKQNPILIQPLSSETIAGYALVEDINGQPALILRVDLPRNIYRQGQSGIAYFLGSLLLTGLVFTLTALWLLERLVLARLLRLSTNVSEIGASSKFSSRVPVSGNDELTHLSRTINQMLGALQQSRDELERRVEERTAELSEANTHLKLEIAERQRVEEALIQARDQALEASRLKTELLAKVSHELRTPLGIILGYTEALQMGAFGPLSAEQQEPAREILQSTTHLTRMITDLLSEAQLEASKLKLNIDSFAPADLATNVHSKMNPLAQAKGITLTTDIAADMPPILWGDSYRLQQILINLVSNAIKFTQQGGVQVQLYRPDPDHWALQVSDTGPGIPAEAQTYIFEPFRQVDGSITRLQAGAGLGLSIVKQLTALMEGQLTLTSQVGQGSTFRVTLPFIERTTFA